jgi:hypothetical protein
MIAVEGGVAVANLRTMGPLWRSPALETSQKIAQTALMWLVPGGYLAVRRAITLPGMGRPEDSTRGAFLGTVTDWTDAAAEANRGEHFDGAPGPDVGHHGHDSGGGHHGGGAGYDGGGHHGGGGGYDSGGGGGGDSGGGGHGGHH